MELSVRLFAGLREAIGRERVTVRLPEGARVADLVDQLGREDALLPPVGGGSDDGQPADSCELTRDPIDAARLVAFVTHPAAGGIALFLGTARDHHEGQAVLRLEYEAYDEMALASFRELARSTRARFPAVRKLAIVHRLGVVPIGEASVAVAVSTAHRGEAFEACRFAIDELKAKAPVWKKEKLADGGDRWVENKEAKL
jgi:molybdopterin synthase catalytic subunit